jgi:hypothetical protein
MCEKHTENSRLLPSLMRSLEHALDGSFVFLATALNAHLL